MSWRGQKRVWDDYRGPPMQKITLLAMADFGDEEGGRIFASLQTIADKINLSRDHTRRQIRALMRAGIVSILANANGGKPGTTPRYRIHFDKLTGCTEATPTDGAAAIPTGGKTGGKSNGDGLRSRKGGVAPRTETGGAGATLTGINRSITGNTKTKERAISSPLTLTFSPSLADCEWLKSEANKRRFEPPGGGTLDAWSEDQTQRFIDHHRADGTKAADWSPKWRNWMRNGFEYKPKDNGSKSRSALGNISIDADGLARDGTGRVMDYSKGFD